MDCPRVRVKAHRVQVMNCVLHVRRQVERQGDRMAVELGREVELRRRTRPGCRSYGRATPGASAGAGGVGGSSHTHRTALHWRGWSGAGPPGRSGPTRSGPRASRTGTGARQHHHSRRAGNRRSTTTRRTSASRGRESPGRRSGAGTARSPPGSGAARAAHPSRSWTLSVTSERQVSKICGMPRAAPTRTCPPGLGSLPVAPSDTTLRAVMGQEQPVAIWSRDIPRIRWGKS